MLSHINHGALPDKTGWTPPSTMEAARKGDSSETASETTVPLVKA
jgi:hypothetical protein